MDEYLAFAKRLANDAGDIMVAGFDTALDEEVKEDGTFVTKIDREINELVTKRVHATYPQHGLKCEESDGIARGPDQLVWVADEIDGTLLYFMGLSLSVFSLALVRNGKPLFGVICEPLGRNRRIYEAVAGYPAYMNGKRINVNGQELGQGTVINYEWWPGAEEGYEIAPDVHALSRAHGVYALHLGSTIASGLLVARGKLAASVTAITKGKFMDVAALIPIIEGAGGYITDLAGASHVIDGSPINGALMSNGIVHNEVLGYCYRSPKH